MGRSITLTPSFQAVHWDYDDGFRITVVASDACGLPDAIFVYLQRPMGPDGADPTGFFDHIASSVDLEEVPVGAPDPEALPPWYRLPTLDLVFRSRAQAIECWEAIQEDARHLLRSLDHQDVMDTGDAVVLSSGDGCTDEGASSSSLMAP